MNNMSNPLRLCLALHNHQPVGNFDGVFEQAYEDSYRPFLDVFEPFDNLRISLHTSGPLMEWLDRHHPEYIDRLAQLVKAGRIEIIGGAFYESILPMIPSRDRIGQISSYTNWLSNRLGADIRGMWMPERVWEQNLTSDLVRAGIDYTILDDFHFKNAGLDQDELNGYFVTEDDGHVLRVFPGSEQLRYLIPFADPQQTIDYLGSVNERHPNSVVVFGDDGEKFGTWPNTKQHVYNDGWLRRFFEAVSANEHWIRTSTMTEALEATQPVGKVYIPEGSYREMTEWALPVKKQLEYEHVSHEMEHDDRWPQIQQFVRGGYWRNFKTKYPETDEMYSRMMIVSQRLDSLRAQGVRGEIMDAAQRELYRGQCNCAYWHGAFGGIYLPHLRNAIFNHLIAADNLLDQAMGKDTNSLDAEAFDFNLDGLPEVLLTNAKLNCFVSPQKGGHLYELDVRSICHNLLATLTRREEAYHAKVRQGENGEGDNVSSIHDRVVFKQEGLDQRLQFDPVRRKSLVDRFYHHDVTLEQVSRNEFEDLGDFAQGDYEAKIRRSADRVQVQLYRDGRVGEHAIRLTKGITLFKGSSTIEFTYLLENLPQETLHFGVELNFAGMPSGADDRYFYHGSDRERLGQLGTQMVLSEVEDLALVDEWLGLDVKLVANRATNFWTFPIETVSQSEGGFEAVHQSVVVQPHWYVVPDEDGKWSATLRVDADTTLADERRHATAATSGHSG